jgi:hypothetical protein
MYHELAPDIARLVYTAAFMYGQDEMDIVKLGTTRSVKFPMPEPSHPDELIFINLRSFN